MSSTCRQKANIKRNPSIYNTIDHTLDGFEHETNNLCPHGLELHNLILVVNLSSIKLQKKKKTNFNGVMHLQNFWKIPTSKEYTDFTINKNESCPTSILIHHIILY